MAKDKAESLEAKITKVMDILEIQNLQYRYQQYMHFRRADKIPALFSQKNTPLIEIGDNMGIAEGMDKVKAFFVMYQKASVSPGVMVDHEATCPVIEVARDGKTARATFISPGLGGNATHGQQLWNWGVYLIDYIKEDGEWKIWHLRWVKTFSTNFEKGWIHEQNADMKDMANTPPRRQAGGAPPPPLFATPNRPSSKRVKAYKLFDPAGPNLPVLEPVEPYDTWTDDMMDEE